MNGKRLSSVSSGAYTHYSTPVDLLIEGFGDSYSVQATVDVDTPIAKTFLAAAVNIVNNTFTIANHGYTLGLKTQISNPGTLPVGISAGTDYFVIVVDANTIKVATTLLLAIAGTPVDITGQGAGTNTITPTAIAGGTIGLEQSNDDVTYAALGNTTAITADGTFILEKQNPTCRYIRVVYVVTAGHLTSTNLVFIKNNTNA